MFQKEVLEILMNNTVFKGLNNEELNAIFDCLQKEVLEKGQIIIKEGQTNECLFLVLEGTLEVFLPQKSDNMERYSKVILNTLTPGTCFGEYSLFDHGPASASVMTKEQSTLYKMTRMNFEKLVQTSHRIEKIISKNLLTMLIQRLRDKETQLDIFIKL